MPNQERSKHLKTDQTLTEVPFSSLELEPALVSGVADAGFHHCTPIQAQALPKGLIGLDLAGRAQTGTGKTAAFLLTTMNRLLRVAPLAGYQKGQPRALILAPTRELAIQIHDDAQVLGAHTELRVGLVYGGAGYDSQRQSLLAGIDLLIATPGRLIDFHRQRVVRLSSIQVVVLDEADRMFDLGFIRDIRYLLRRMPKPEKRQNLLFSATLSSRVSELAYEHMNDPIAIDASCDQVTVDTVTHRLFHVAREEKIPLLLGLLQRMDVSRTIVFVNTKRVAERLSGYLGSNGLDAGLLTGDVPQRKRIQLLEQFRRGRLPILVATDVAARGLHIPDVSHVFNYDLPQEAEDYVHRVGRTARAGASGEAISFACEEYVFSLPQIEAFIDQKIPVSQFSDDLLVAPVHPRRMKGTRSQPGLGKPSAGRAKRRRRASPNTAGRASSRERSSDHSG
jgi:ATP-dependent RNA helicase RhlB